MFARLVVYKALREKDGNKKFDPRYEVLNTKQVNAWTPLR